MKLETIRKEHKRLDTYFELYDQNKRYLLSTVRDIEKYGSRHLLFDYWKRREKKFEETILWIENRIQLVINRLAKHGTEKQ